MTVDELNSLDHAAASREFLRCCGSARWAEGMTAARPFATFPALVAAADAIWNTLDSPDWLEALAAHPKIGDRRTGAAANAAQAGMTAREGETGRTEDMGKTRAAEWSEEEQAGVRLAAADVRDRLAAANREYEARFGYIFVVCATGKSAGEMLRLLEQRLRNDAATELRAAANEQCKITRLRLAKLLNP